MAASPSFHAWTAGAVALLLALALPVQAEYEDPLSKEERAHVSQHGPIRVVLGPTGAPFAFEQGGLHRGLSVDVLRLMSVNLGVEFSTRIADDFGQGYQALQDGTADVYGPAAPDAGRLDVAYTHSFARIGFGFWVGPTMVAATTPSDLDGHRVAVSNVSLHITTLHRDFPGVTPVVVRDSTTGAHMLARGEVDGLYAGYSNIGYLLRDDHVEGLRPLGEPRTMSQATWAVRDDDPLLHSILNKGLASIGKNQLDALHVKWTGLSLQAPVHDRDPVLAWVLGATAGGAGLLVVHSTVLRHQVKSQTRRLRAERDKFVRIMETNPGPVLVVGPDRHILYANGRAEEMLRLSSPVPGTWTQPAWEMDDLDGDPLPDHETPFVRALETRRPVHRQPLQIRWADGTVLPVSCNAAPLLDDDGQTIAIVLALEDLRDHLAAQHAHRKEVERRAEVRRLREIDAFRTEFMNAAAHEIKTPLTPLGLQLHLLETDATGLSPAQRHSVEVLRRNLDRLSRIARDMLDITRIESGQLSIEPRSMDLGALAVHTTHGFQAMADEHGVRLKVDATDCFIEGDEALLNQVIEHLVSNAIKFTPAGGSVEVRVHGEHDEACIEVCDSGIGLSQEQQDRLFMPFARLHTDRHTAPGTGLGLHVTKRIVEAHGGRVACHSEGADLGSTFTVSVPRQAETPAVTLTA